MRANLYLISLFISSFASHAQEDLDLDSIDLGNLPEANATGLERELKNLVIPTFGEPIPPFRPQKMTEEEKKEEIQRLAEQILEDIRLFEANSTFEGKAGGVIKEYLTKILKLQKDFNALKGSKEFLSRGVPIIKEEGELTTRFLDDKEGELPRIVAEELDFRVTEYRGLTALSQSVDSSPQERARFGRLADEADSRVEEIFDLENKIYRLGKRMSGMQRMEQVNLEYITAVLEIEEFKLAIQQIEKMKIEWNEKINFQIEAINSFLDLLPARAKSKTRARRSDNPNP